MKKIIITFCAALAAASLASCTKEINFNQSEGAPAGRNIPEDWITLSFSADATRTTLDGGSIQWSDGDSVKVLWDNTADGWNAGVVTDGTLTLAVKDTTDYFAVYPASADATIKPSRLDADGYKLENDTLCVTLTQLTNGSWAKANIMAAATTKDELQLGFKNVCSFIKFEVENPDVNYVAFRANDDSPATGTISMTFDGSEPNFLEGLTSTRVEVQASIAGPGTYYLPVSPSLNWAKGFGVLYRNAEGVRTGTLTTAALTIDTRSKCINLGRLDAKFHEGDWFIKADGTGDGSSWDNAGGPRLLKDILGNSLSPKNTTNAWRINGATIRIAGGNYDLKDENTADGLLTMKYTSPGASVVIKGGYNPASTGVDTTSRDVAAYQTVLTTTNPSSVSNNRLFTINDAYLSLTVDGIKFTGSNYSGRGGIFYINASAGYGKFEFNDCTFEDIKNSSYGAAIDVNNSKVNDFVTFNRCVFKNNSATYGGAVIVEVAAGEKGAVFKDCTFSGNKATASTSGGGAVYMKADKAVATFEGCTFLDNVTAATGGGAIFATGKGTVLNISGCHFEGNISNATGGGAIAISGGGTSALGATAYINGCSFKGNKCETASGELNGNGGALLQVGSNKSLLYMNGCTFDSNAAKTNGPDLFSSAGTAACIYNCTSATPVNNSSDNFGCVRCNCPLLMANSTMVVYGTAGTTSGTISFGTSKAEENTIVNNLILNNGGSAIGTGSSSTKRNATTYGHNVLGKAPLITFTDNGNATDVTEKLASALWASAPSYNADGLIEWNGPATLEGFTAATPAEVEAAMKAYNPTTIKANVGEDFYNWLVSIDAFDKDGAGNSRGSTSWWPGSYQNNL